MKKYLILNKLHHFFRKLIFPTDQLISLIPKKSKILDLGCGNGFVFKNLKKCKSYLGVDINSKKIKELNNIKKKSSHSFLCKDITKILPRHIYKKANTILLVDVIHHIAKNKQLECLKNLLKSVSKNTIIIIKDIDSQNFITSKFNWFHDLIVNKCIIFYFDFSKIKKIKGITIVNEFTTRKFLYDHYFLILKKI